MTHQHTFYKDPDDRWYIDLPEYIENNLGTKANLEMVAGADDLLDILAEGDSKVLIKYSDQPFDGHTLELVRSSDYAYDPEFTQDPEWDGGAFYTIKGSKHNLWLCPVTLYVFNGAYPTNIYIQKV